MAINLNFGWVQAFGVEEGVQSNTEGTDATVFQGFEVFRQVYEGNSIS